MSIRFVEAADAYATLRMSGYARATWKAERGKLGRFAAWIVREHGESVEIAAVGPRAVGRHLDGLRPPARQASTFNGYRQTLRLFFDHCMPEGWIIADPTRYVRAERVRKRYRLQLSAGECVAMLDRANPRDRVALAIGINTGLRASDLIDLRVGDVDFE